MAGITLVELLMTLIIVSIVMVSIYNVLQHSLSAHSHVEAQAEVIQNARMAMERFSKEVRQACNFRNPCDIDIIHFGIDNNGDGDDGDPGDMRIEYTLYLYQGEYKLRRRERVLPASFPLWRVDETVIADYVTGFTLSYRDIDNNLLATPVGDPTLIQLVSADISLEKARRGAKGKELYTVDLRVTAHPRNR